MEQTNKPNTMAFYNPDGFVPAFKQAAAFAGERGHVATLPDIIEARIANPLGTPAWEQYFTAMSAEYVGLSHGGVPIAIVAHGVGPMSTLDGILAAYSHEFSDKERNRRGGRIPQAEFLKLESGVYGEVHVIDLISTWKRRLYQFSGHAITRQEIRDEPLWQARLGKNWNRYVITHAALARKWHAEQAGTDPENTYNLPNHKEFCNRRRAMHLRLAGAFSEPSILAMDCASNCSYFDREMFDHWMKATPKTAIAHLLSIGGLMHSHHDYFEFDYDRREQRESLASDVSCHEWWNGVRLLGVRPDIIPGTISIHPGLPNFETLLKGHLEQLLRPNPDSAKQKGGFYHLLQIGNQHFTEYPKRGDRMDTGAPEFVVTSVKPVQGGPFLFNTSVGGFYGYFKYGIKEVSRLAPKGANAYMFTQPIITNPPGRKMQHTTGVKFFKVEVDTSRRVIRDEDVYRDYEFMMSLID